MSLQAMVPKERPTDPELMKPDEEEIEKVSKERGERRSRGRENSLSIGSRVSFSEKWEALLRFSKQAPVATLYRIISSDTV